LQNNQQFYAGEFSQLDKIEIESKKKKDCLARSFFFLGAGTWAKLLIWPYQNSTTRVASKKAAESGVCHGNSAKFQSIQSRGRKVSEINWIAKIAILEVQQNQTKRKGETRTKNLRFPVPRNAPRLISGRIFGARSS
jgi:hypothetical protein